MTQAEKFPDPFAPSDVVVQSFGWEADVAGCCSTGSVLR